MCLCLQAAFLQVLHVFVWAELGGSREKWLLELNQFMPSSPLNICIMSIFDLNVFILTTVRCHCFIVQVNQTWPKVPNETC